MRKMAFELPKLDYAYDALEPYIDATTMEIHHTKHHQAYIDNLNKALENYPELQKKSIEDLLQNVSDAPQDIRQAIINHGGGHANHSFFWKILSPHAEARGPQGALKEELEKTFSSFEKFKEQFSEKAMGVFGSGWAWLVVTPDKKLMLKRHSFQNNPLLQGNTPILGLDVWEHAYYLKYQNRRKEYVEAFWNIVNWEKIEELFNVSSSR